MGMQSKNSIVRYYRVERSQIAFIKFVLEAYDNLAILSTIDSRRGLICLRIGPGCEDTLTQLMDDLGQHIPMKALP